MSADVFFDTNVVLYLYDGTIAASALLAVCRILYSEDFRDGRLIDGQLKVRNPFA